MAAYFLFENVEVSDPAALASYAQQVGPLVAKHGGRYLDANVVPGAIAQSAEPALSRPLQE